MPAQLMAGGSNSEVDQADSIALGCHRHQVAPGSSSWCMASDPSLLTPDWKLICRSTFVGVPHLEQPVPAGGEEEASVDAPGHVGNISRVAVLVRPANVQSEVRARHTGVVYVKAAIEGPGQEVAALLGIEVHASESMAECTSVYLCQSGQLEVVLESGAQVLPDNGLVNVAQTTSGKQLGYALH